MSKAIVITIIFLFLSASLIGGYFIYKKFIKPALTPEENYNYLVEGKIGNKSIEMDFLLLNLTGQSGLTNQYTTIYQGSTSAIDIRQFTVHQRLQNPVFFYGKNGVCYYSKLATSYDAYRIVMLDCNELGLVGNLTVDIIGRLGGGENAVIVNISTNHRINNPAVCITDWSFNIISADFLNLKEKKIPEALAIKCYSFERDLINSTASAVLSYNAFEVLGGDYIEFMVLDQDRRISNIGLEENMYYFDGVDIGMPNQKFRVTI